MFTQLSCDRASLSVFAGVTVSQLSLASTQPRLVLQVPVVGVMHVGVTVLAAGDAEYVPCVPALSRVTVQSQYTGG